MQLKSKIATLFMFLVVTTTTYASLQVDTNEYTEVKSQADLNGFFNEADEFFRTYVSGGLVDYAGLATNKTSLTTLVTTIGKVSLQDAGKDTKIAFYINAYNILTIQQIVANWPMKSPLDKSGFFDATKFLVAGETLTLNDIENKKLRPDPRVHFVLVCGAMGCPPLLNTAYMPDAVQTQLSNQTAKALNNPQFIRVDGNKVAISHIFKWYADDFIKASGSIEKYLNAHRSVALPSGATISYYEYDWKVNARK